MSNLAEISIQRWRAKQQTAKKKLDGDRERTEILEERFMYLAASNQAIISFTYEYKNQMPS